jgi:hypothetical protein
LLAQVWIIVTATDDLAAEHPEMITVSAQSLVGKLAA